MNYTYQLVQDFFRQQYVLYRHCIFLFLLRDVLDQSLYGLSEARNFPVEFSGEDEVRCEFGTPKNNRHLLRRWEVDLNLICFLLFFFNTLVFQNSRIPSQEVFGPRKGLLRRCLDPQTPLTRYLEDQGLRRCLKKERWLATPISLGLS